MSTLVSFGIPPKEKGRDEDELLTPSFIYYVRDEGRWGYKTHTHAHGGDVGWLAGHDHGVHDGEGLRVQDVDSRGFRPQHQAAHGRLLRVGLFQGGDARHHRLPLQGKPAVQLDEGLKKEKDN